MTYLEFLKSKTARSNKYGIDIDKCLISEALFPFQRDIVYWALRKGRCALFLDTGLGKTHCQTEWARLIAKRSLIVAPLSVARQTVRISKQVTGADVFYVRNQSQCKDGINITNYEMIENFDPAQFGAVVLDESSILKNLGGATRQLVTKMFADTPYRLCCTATPAPNDEAEIGTHSEFLGIMKNNEMLATYFINGNKIDEVVYKDGFGNLGIAKRKQAGRNGQEWRLRNYGRKSFYKWMCTWSMSIRKPSDIGGDDKGYVLPELRIHPTWVDVDCVPEGQLFFTGLKGIQNRASVRKMTSEDRVRVACELVNGDKDQWVVWCGLNEESHALSSGIDGAIEVVGSDEPEQKAAAIESFQDGKYRVLVTKPKIAGFGMNLQNAHKMVFVGLSDSWEAYYQCIRREWRFGQMHPVDVYIVLSTVEREIYENVLNKNAMATRMTDELIANVKTYEREEITGGIHMEDVSVLERTESGNAWTAMLGDSCKRLAEIDDCSIDMSIYSPPFADLYTYSASDCDLGNSKDWTEFFRHYDFIVRHVLRVTKSGRISCVHTSDIAAMAMKDGYIGVRDFPGAVIRAHESAGWIYHGYAVVAKNPQAQAIRTKSKALLFVQLTRDSSDSRPAILDRVLFFKKPGKSAVPVTPVENKEMDNETWIDWAGGIWVGIRESDTLQYSTARDANDEKHICPLQLGTIERCIKLYSNPGETILSPFMGIGSEIYQAVKLGRIGIGCELKESYYRIAVQNIRSAAQSNDLPLFAQCL